MPDKYKLNIFLMKEEYTEFLAVMREDLIESIHMLAEHFNIDGVIYIGRNNSKAPDWLTLLQQGASDDIGELLNSSTRAVLLVKVNNRIFAFPFGFGRFMLKEESIVRDFGLKTVLNSIHPSKLLSIDIATFDELTLHSRTQTSRASSISTFQIDKIKDLLRSVTGNPENDEFGFVISGRDSMQLTQEIDFNSIGELCRELLTKYNIQRYRTYFPWVDNLREVNDPGLLSILNDSLLSTINNRDDNRFHLAPPQIIDWENICGFAYTRGGERMENIIVADFFEYLGEQQINLDFLKRHQIYVKDSTNNEIIDHWSIHKCIVYETQLEDDIYILTVGSWFKVNHAFVEEVNIYLEAIPDTTNITLPPCRAAEREDDYSIRVADSSPNIINLDKKLVTIDGSKIEICDLLADDGKLIHIKKWNSSATLSHLFSQGRVSATCLLGDRSFRIKAREIIEEVNPSFVTLINEEEFDTVNTEIVYAIIDRDTRPLHERLPFFSKLNMMQNVKYLQNLRFNVSKYRISWEDH